MRSKSFKDWFFSTPLGKYRIKQYERKKRKEWRKNNPDLNGNIRDYADLLYLIILLVYFARSLCDVAEYVSFINLVPNNSSALLVGKFLTKEEPIIAPS